MESLEGIVRTVTVSSRYSSDLCGSAAFFFVEASVDEGCGDKVVVFLFVDDVKLFRHDGMEGKYVLVERLEG